MLAWKCLYPIGIHFAISQVLSYLGMYLLVWRTGADITAYYQQALLLTGLTGILASVPCIWLYRGDYRRRSLTGILGRLGKELTPAFQMAEYRTLVLEAERMYLAPAS